MDSFQKLQAQQDSILSRLGTLTDDYEMLQHAHEQLVDDHVKLWNAHEGLKARVVELEQPQLALAPAPSVDDERDASISALLAEAAITRTGCERVAREVSGLKIKVTRECDRLWSAIHQAQLYSASGHQEVASEPDAFVVVARKSAGAAGTDTASKHTLEEPGEQSKTKHSRKGSDFASKERQQHIKVEYTEMNTPELTRKAYSVFQSKATKQGTGLDPADPLRLCDEDETHVDMEKLQNDWRMRKARMGPAKGEEDVKEEDGGSPRRSQRHTKLPTRCDGCILYTRRDCFE